MWHQMWRTQRQESMIKELKKVSRVIVTGKETLTDNQGPTFKESAPEIAVLIAESEESGSEYKGADDLESESELDIESEGPELEDKEPDKKIQLKAGKKQKMGIVARDQISAVVAAINDEPSLSPRLDLGYSSRATGSKAYIFPNWSSPCLSFP